MPMAMRHGDDCGPSVDALDNSLRPAAIKSLGDRDEFGASFAAFQFPLIHIGKMLTVDDNDGLTSG